MTIKEAAEKLEDTRFAFDSAENLKEDCEAVDIAIASLEAWQDVLVRIERYADADAYGDYQLGIKCGAEYALDTIRDKMREIENEC